MNLSRIIQFLGVLIICALSFFLMLYASFHESAIMDELAHIPAGYGYVRYLDYRLNPEHPPLLKMLSAIPLLIIHPNFPINSRNWKDEINGQWAVGSEFLYESGNNPDQIIRWARIPPMLLTILLAVFVFIWSRELIGGYWALVPTYLFALSPTVLAHGHYVTTDLAAAFGDFVALYYFVKLLVGSPRISRKNLMFAGISFGVAQLLKFSSVILIPFYLFLIFIFYLVSSTSYWDIKLLARYVGITMAVFFIGYLFVYPFYYLTTINYPIEKQVSDTKFILTSFAGGNDFGLSSCNPLEKIPLNKRMRCLAEVNISMANNGVLRPYAEYLLGLLMVIQRGAGGNTTYFLGEVSSGGWWYYFPVVFLLKEPLSSLLLISLGVFLALRRLLKSILSKRWGLLNYININFAEFTMLSFIFVYWFISIRSPLNIGMRHIIPTLPFIYILTASSIKKWATINFRFPYSGSWLHVIIDFIKSVTSRAVRLSVLMVLMIGYFVSTAWASPYYLSFFNSIGGNENGFKYVTDSNFDWGQDLLRLVDFVNANNIDRIAIDYFGGGSPRYYLGERAVYWNSSKGNPLNYGIEWIAISINTIQGARGKLAPGEKRNPENEYPWLSESYKPYAKAGTSIFIYKLSE